MDDEYEPDPLWIEDDVVEDDFDEDYIPVRETGFLDPGVFY